jgi:hypothetical protein
MLIIPYSAIYGTAVELGLDSLEASAFIWVRKCLAVSIIVSDENCN